MFYQLPAVPMHALGALGAWAVLGLCFWGELVWLGVRRAAASAPGPRWNGLDAVSLAAGLYPTAWYATSGAHALRGTAFADARLLLLENPKSTVGRLFTFQPLLVAASCTKVSILPVVFALCLWALLSIWRSRDESPLALRGALAVLPWLVWQGLPLAWTWVHPGSPWAPGPAGGRAALPPVAWREHARAHPEHGRDVMPARAVTWSARGNTTRRTQVTVYALVASDRRLLGGLHPGRSEGLDQLG
jgi:hypothetical protein